MNYNVICSENEHKYKYLCQMRNKIDDNTIKIIDAFYCEKCCCYNYNTQIITKDTSTINFRYDNEDTLKEVELYDVDGAYIKAWDILGMLHMACEYQDTKLCLVLDDDKTKEFVTNLAKMYKII